MKFYSFSLYIYWPLETYQPTGWSLLFYMWHKIKLMLSYLIFTHKFTRKQNLHDLLQEQKLLQPMLMYDDNNTPKLTSHGYFSYILISISPIIFCTNVHYCTTWEVRGPVIVMQSYLLSIYIQKKNCRTVQPIITEYCQTPNISCTWMGNKIVDHSDVVGASSVGAAPTTSSFSTDTWLQ